MIWVENFFFQNFILLFVAVVMIITAGIRYKSNPKMSIYIILIMVFTLLLAVFAVLENYSKSIVNEELTILFSFLGYTLRPLCLFLFILNIDDSLRGKYAFLLGIPLIVNLVIYLLCFVPTLREYVVFFYVGDDGALHFGGGVLRFTSHVVAVFYLVYVLYCSFSSLRFKRLSRGIVTLGCVLAITGAVVIESFFDAKGDIYILNTVIAMSVFVYYLHFNVELSQLDETTGLYKKEMFKTKGEKNAPLVSAVMMFKISLDVPHGNSPVIADDDKVIATVAKVVLKNIGRRMMVFRIDIDRFLLIALQYRKEATDMTYEKLKSSIVIPDYRIDIGYAYRNGKEELSEMILRAERMANLVRGNN